MHTELTDVPGSSQPVSAGPGPLPREQQDIKAKAARFSEFQHPNAEERRGSDEFMRRYSLTQQTPGDHDGVVEERLVPKRRYEEMTPRPTSQSDWSDKHVEDWKNSNIHKTQIQPQFLKDLPPSVPPIMRGQRKKHVNSGDVARSQINREIFDEKLEWVTDSIPKEVKRASSSS